jgi:hypothetical protein
MKIKAANFLIKTIFRNKPIHCKWIIQRTFSNKTKVTMLLKQSNTKNSLYPLDKNQTYNFPKVDY